jgi:DNA-binding NarL/FixJ family response regulator
MEAVPLIPSHPRILIADDHVLFTETLRKYLAKTFAVVGTTAGGRSLVKKRSS